MTVKLVTAAEEYLQDHFPGFPVLPGVMMLESMVQAARLVADPDGSAPAPMVLGHVRAVKYGNFVRPGESLRVAVEAIKRHEDGSIDFKGQCRVIRDGDGSDEFRPIACTGRFTLRPARLGPDRTAPDNRAALATDG